MDILYKSSLSISINNGNFRAFIDYVDIQRVFC